MIPPRSFGPGDWFETTEEEGCDNPPEDGDGDDGDEGDEGDEGGDEGTFDEDNGGNPERFISLTGVDVCDGVRGTTTTATATTTTITTTTW